MTEAHRSCKLLLLFLTLAIPALFLGASASHPLGLTLFESAVLPLAVAAAATLVFHQEAVTLPSLTDLSIALLTSFLISNIVLAPRCCFRGQGQLTGCKSNLKIE